MKSSDQIARSIGIVNHHNELHDGVSWKHLQTESGPLEFAFEFSAGAWSQDRTLPGLAHFHEHMVIKESQNYPDESFTDNFYSRLGIRRNASTAVDVMTVIFAAPNIIAAKKAAEVVYDKITNPLFLKKRLDIERGAIQAELKQRSTSPIVEIYNQYTNLLMTGGLKEYSALGGSSKVIDTIGTEDIVKHHKTVNEKGLAQIITVGPVEVGQLTELVRQFTSTFPGGKQQADIQMPRGSHHFSHSGGQQMIRIGYSARGSLTLRELVTLRILKRLLTSGQTSYLFDFLRNKKGRVYSVSGASSVFKEWHELSAQTSFSDHISSVDVDEIFSLIEKDFIEWLTPKKLADLQENQRNVAVMNFETNHSKLMQTTTLNDCGDDANVLTELTVLMSIQFEELLVMAQTLLAQKNRYSVLMNIESK